MAKLVINRTDHSAEPQPRNGDHYEPPDGLTQLAESDVDAVVTHRYPGVSWSAPTGVRTMTLIADPLLLMVAAEHPLAGRTRVDTGKLRDETFISGTTPDPNRIALAAAAAGAGFAPQVAFKTADYASELARNLTETAQTSMRLSSSS